MFLTLSGRRFRSWRNSRSRAPSPRPGTSAPRRSPPGSRSWGRRTAHAAEGRSAPRIAGSRLAWDKLKFCSLLPYEFDPVLPFTVLSAVQIGRPVALGDTVVVVRVLPRLAPVGLVVLRVARSLAAVAVVHRRVRRVRAAVARLVRVAGRALKMVLTYVDQLRVFSPSLQLQGTIVK